MEYLTEEEFAAMNLSAALSNLMGTIIGSGPTRLDDLREFVVHMHAIQNMILAQAAARAYPTRFRLMGNFVKDHDEVPC